MTLRMRLAMLFAIGAALCFVVLASPATAYAQIGCGSASSCTETCDVDRFQPLETTYKTVSLLCNDGDCGECTLDPLVADAAPSEAALLSQLLGATAEELPEVVAKYQSRLLIHPSRKLVAVRASGCDDDAITSVAFLNQEKTDALVSLGIGRLDTFLSSLGSEG